MNVKPLGDRVLVQPVEEAEVKKGGIIIPDTAKEKPQEGKVVAIGTGKRDENGKLIPFEVKKGDRVFRRVRCRSRRTHCCLANSRKHRRTVCRAGQS